MQNILLRCYRTLLITESFLLLFFLFTAIIIACAQIFLRNFFDTGIFWADSALRVLVLWIGMIGAMYASRNKQHIRIDIFSHYLPDNITKNIDRITDLLTAIVCGVVAFYSIKFIQYEYADGLIAFANVPVWLCETIIPFAFIVMALRYLIFSFLPSRISSPDANTTTPAELK